MRSKTANKLDAADAGAPIDEQRGQVAHRREPSDSAGRRWSLAGRLAVWYTLSTFVLVLGSIGFLYWGLVETLEREDDQYLADKARVLFGVLHERHDVNPSTAIGEQDGRRGESLDEWRRELAEEVERETGARTPGAFHLRAIGRDGTTLIESAGMADSLPASIFPPPIALDDRRPQAKERTSAAGRAYRVLAFRDDIVDTAASAPGFIVQVAMDRTAEEQLLAAYRWYVGAAVALALFGCGWVGRLLVRRGLSPLNSIVAASNRIRSTTLDQRLPLDGLPVELASLAESLNQMFDRLEDSFRRLERFSGDIAHEMRTPLNNLRGAVEVSLRQPRALDEYRELLGSSLEEFGRLSDLIDSLLFLARADNPREQLALRPTVVANELLAVCEFYDAAAQEVGVELR
ncbi:MAG TPA: histidine kinase dimerization/phospho-acceptor domain-containing protein, partial [Pirellulaceae bacterium]|nr:histidine kinase dimerization/phospho-acceptor domain-containing protein [Pirellulaceae bacterium]